MSSPTDFVSMPDRNDAPLFYRYRFANVDHDESADTLTVGGREVELEPRPRALLSELLRRPNEVISKDELLDLLWEGRPTVDNVLANAVNKLRRALGAAGERIVNVPRVGYKFTGSVERVGMGRQVGEAITLATGQAVPHRPAFRLEHALGASTSAPVWLARDPKLQELRVFKFATDSERLTALKREYTLYRVLRTELGERDDFAKVLSANFADAPYFLECEYGGQDLLAWAAEGDRLQSIHRADRIALFLQIARAVASAHGVGVLHKDLKPANVLIAPAGDGWQAKLTDFGSSRLLEPGRLAELGVTAMGLTMTHGVGTEATSGTPLYLAPELMAGKAPTTRSDLYALGLMLYQLLVGDFRRPMATCWQRDITDPLLCDDLIAATEGRPEERLGSVEEWIERLSTLENRRADQARRAASDAQASAMAEQLQRSRSRRPWVVAAFASLAIGLAASLWFYSRAGAALLVAKQESLRAQAVNDFLTKDVLPSPDVIKTQNVKAVSMLDVLRRASQRVSERFKDQPLVEASVRFQLGRVYMRMANFVDATVELKKAQTLLAALVPPSDGQLLSVRFTLARLMTRVGRPESAAALLSQAGGSADPELLSNQSDVALAAALANRDLLILREDYAAAVAPALRAMALTDTLSANDLDERLDVRAQLVMVYTYLNEAGKAQAVLDELTRPPFGTTRAAEVALARMKLRSASIELWTRKNVKLAESEFTQGRDMMIQALGPNDLQVALANADMAAVYDQTGDYAAALRVLQAALAGFEAVFGREHQYWRITAINIAEAELRLGHAEAALRITEANKSWFTEHIEGGLYPALDFVQGGALNELGRHAEALSALSNLKIRKPDEEAIQENTKRIWLQRWSAERARAIIGLGRSAEGLTQLAEAVAELDRLHARPWDVEPYRKLLADRPSARRGASG